MILWNTPQTERESSALAKQHEESGGTMKNLGFSGDGYSKFMSRS